MGEATRLAAYSLLPGILGPVTYSIVARDPVTGQLGGAVQTKVLAGTAGVLWAEPGIGVVATQAIPNFA